MDDENSKETTLGSISYVICQFWNFKYLVMNYCILSELNKALICCINFKCAKQKYYFTIGKNIKSWFENIFYILEKNLNCQSY